MFGAVPARESLSGLSDKWIPLRLHVYKGRVEHWVNGRKMADYDCSQPGWAMEAKANSGGWPMKSPGYIALQWHQGGGCAFRNIKIREAEKPSAATSSSGDGQWEALSNGQNTDG